MKKLRYIFVAVGVAAAVGLFSAARSTDFEMGRTMEILVNMFREVNLFYVDPVDPDELLGDAARGMTSGLDPYTEFLSEKDMEQFEVMTTGKYGGIGSLIRQKADGVYIAEPYEGFPADKAGLRIGDRILEVDGVGAAGLTTSDISDMLKGDPGTTVRVKVQKFDTGEQETVRIRRERIVISGVPYWGFISDGIGYIQHSDFTEDCSSDVRHALMEMKSSGNLRGLVLDYRDNGGGILQEAVKILSLFVPKGTEVVSMRGKVPEMSASFRTETEPVDLTTPIVVLTNGGSASAAEIVAGALQDLDRAVLVGQRTYGKGLVQATRPLGYNAYLKVTTAKYYIPSGRCIQAIDYAQRNEDGSVSFVPDSLVMEFTTKGGRKVYDGGGVMPDVRIPAEQVSPFTIIAYNRGYLDDFGDVYAKKHPGAVDLSTFRLGDEGYAEFAAFMQDKDMEYQSQTKTALAALRQQAVRERHYDSISEQLTAIENLLNDDKQASLELYRDELAEIIEADVILRHHYRRGVIEYQLASDSELDEAGRILAAPEEYRRIVTSQDTARR